MRLLSTVAAALCLAASMASGESTEGMAPRIVGGVEVNPPFKYPWMVTLFAQVDEKTNFPFCGGSLIDPSYILTAAHCSVVFDPSILSAAVHRHDLSKTSAAESGIVRTITKVIVHRDYNPAAVSNDYAVWKLSSPITNVDLVTLDTTGIAATGNDALVMGWGTTQYEGDASAILLETSLKIIDFTTCNTFWKGELDPSIQVCAGVDAGGKDTCQGDSGGPMLISSGGNLVQVGVVSFGRGCADANSPGVYSKVAGATTFFSAAKDDTRTDGCDKNPCKSGETCITSIDTYACITAEGGSGTGTSPAQTLFPSLFVALLALIFSLFHF